jgi:ankyrin repeat protein
MNRSAAALAGLLLGTLLWAMDAKRPSYPYDVAVTHEIKPHRRQVPIHGVGAGLNQLRLTLTVSPTGDVLEAKAFGNPELLKFWPQLRTEVLQWKFTPFEEHGKVVTAEIEEYIDLVPPTESHVAAPALRPDSKVTITLERSGCFGSCPSYSVAVSTDGIEFDGSGYVVAQGKHSARVDADEVRKLASRFVASDFYSMEAKYIAAVTDNPGYTLSITIDGHEKTVLDYVGSWVGMPAVISELERDVDALALTQRWISGDEGLVQARKEEKFSFQTHQAQAMLKAVASRGKATAVREFLEAGVPLEPLSASTPKSSNGMGSFQAVGWLTAASAHPQVLKIFMDAGASKNDQGDKDLALAGAARAGSLEAARALITYGANPNADLSKLTVSEDLDGMTMQRKGAGSVLIYAAESGNPKLLREILRYHPKLEKRDHEGKTAIFAAGDSRNGDEDGARVECVRLLARAGANVNARDEDGNTPLHETFLTDVEEELLKLGANVNARNNDGETPIFTTVDDEAITLFTKHGADLTIRNKKGQTVLEAAKEKGPLRQQALRDAIDNNRR